MHISIAIDGPAGAGKSTIASIVASKFDLVYINTGSMYRAITLIAMRNKISHTDVKSVCELAKSLKIRFKGENIIVNDEDVSIDTRSINVTNAVSNYASIPELREILVRLQRDISNEYDVVMDGRDIGTVVLKDADIKFFLTADIRERARRRFQEFKEKGINVEYNKILNDIIKRDYIDSHRKLSPLKKAQDAIEIDSSRLDINEVVDMMSKYIMDYIKSN
ncbi:(d)CMP kinase [Clostridium fermenticellae]|uniref:Cytidylate kinase n=1 Tax=Clostridium fermenticellae TaxID=2068654 RepID=A0A386H3T0_9CLOT|nr:(d)CMP kinase [Clostridium fermenticellae]AYD40304.1 (d)CMP kinase [Clostridium fermenticellae]